MQQALNSIKLDKSVPIPLYYQLKQQVLALIQDSTLQDGDMLPPENMLCELWDVSRPTIRQAFGELVAEGCLSRYKGKGTFVSKPKVEERFLSKLETFNDEMRSKGLIPHTQVLGLEKLTAPHEAHERLGIPLEEPLIYLSRLRSADHTPLVYVETFLPYRQYAKLMEVDFTTASLYESLEQLYQVYIHRAQRQIEAVNARPRESKLLQIEQNKAVSLVKTVAYANKTDVPVEFSIARYRGDLNKFSVDIYR